MNSWVQSYSSKRIVWAIISELWNVMFLNIEHEHILLRVILSINMRMIQTIHIPHKSCNTTWYMIILLRWILRAFGQSLVDSVYLNKVLDSSGSVDETFYHHISYSDGCRLEDLPNRVQVYFYYITFNVEFQRSISVLVKF